MNQKAKSEAAGFFTKEYSKLKNFIRSYISDFRKWRHYDQYWKEEGEESFNKYVELKGSEKQGEEE